MHYVVNDDLCKAITVYRIFNKFFTVWVPFCSGHILLNLKGNADFNKFHK
jgi:hypothetical protein